MPLANCALAASASGRRPRPSRAAARQAELLSRRRAATRAPAASKVNRASRASKGQQGQQGGGQGEQGEDGQQGPGPASKVRAKPATSRGGSAAGTGHQPEPAIGGDLRPSVRQLAPGTTNEDQPFNPTESINNPNPEDAFNNEAQVSYSQVHARYQEKAVQSLENTYIPGRHEGPQGLLLQPNTWEIGAGGLGEISILASLAPNP